MKAADLPPDEEFARLERAERLRLCLDHIRKSGEVRTRDLAAFERYVLQGERAERVAKLYGLAPQRVYDIKRELLDRIRKMLVKMDIELGEV